MLFDSHNTFVEWILTTISLLGNPVILPEAVVELLDVGAGFGVLVVLLEIVVEFDEPVVDESAEFIEVQLAQAVFGLDVPVVLLHVLHLLHVPRVHESVDLVGLLHCRLFVLCFEQFGVGTVQEFVVVSRRLVDRFEFFGSHVINFILGHWTQRRVLHCFEVFECAHVHLGQQVGV